MINDFIIKGTLGNGGMGTVYLAHQLSLDRPVALKILMEQFSRNSEFIVDFVREARAAARLNHPNIVQSYAVGEDEGIYFFAMEYVEGKTLKDLLQEQQQLTWEQVLNIIQQIAEALDFAWKNQQLVHRDIKPDNIMLTNRGVAKLADLGLARAAHETIDDDDEVMGTPQYICPEQLLGQPMDVRGDIYSLGATMFHALTGAFPFEGNSAAEIARKHLNEPVADLRQFDGKIPAEVTYIVQKMMAKKLEDRYEDAEELVLDIGFVLRGQKPAGYSPGGAAKKKKTYHGRKTGVKMPAAKNAKAKAASRTKRPTGSLKKSRTRLKTGTNAGRSGTGGHRAMPALAQVVEQPVEDAHATSGGGRKMSVKKTGRIKVSGSRKSSVRQSSASTGSYRPPGAPAKAGGGGKVAVVFLLLVIGILGGLITWFIIQYNKYNFKSSAQAKALYLEQKVASPTEREDYLALEVYLKPDAAPEGEEAEKAYNQLTKFLDDHPGSLFSNYARGNVEAKTQFYVQQYKVPLDIPFFAKNISKTADPLAGSVRWYRDNLISEYYVRYLRSQDKKEFEQQQKIAACEYDFDQAKAEAKADMEAIVAELAGLYGDKHTEISSVLSGIKTQWSEEKSERRNALLELTKALKFTKAKNQWTKWQMDKKRYTKSVKPEIRNLMRQTPLDRAKPKIRAIDRKFLVFRAEPLGRVKDELSTVEFEDWEQMFEDMAAAGGGINDKVREIQDLAPQEDALFEARRAWFDSHTQGLEGAMKYHFLVADTQGDFPDDYKKPERPVSSKRIEYDLVPKNRNVKPYVFRKVQYKNGDKVIIKSILRYGMVVVVHRTNKDMKTPPIGTETVPLTEVIRLGLFHRIAIAGAQGKGMGSDELRLYQGYHDFYVRPDKAKNRLEPFSTDNIAKFLMDELTALGQ